MSEKTWSAVRVHGRLRGICFRDVRWRRALLLKQAGAWKASCDWLCRADEAAGRQYPLADVRVAGGQQGGCLLWQLVRRISGRKRMSPRLVSRTKMAG